MDCEQRPPLDPPAMPSAPAAMIEDGKHFTRSLLLLLLAAPGAVENVPTSSPSSYSYASSDGREGGTVPHRGVGEVAPTVVALNPSPAHWWPQPPACGRHLLLVRHLRPPAAVQPLTCLTCRWWCLPSASGTQCRCSGQACPPQLAW